jgi:hypothetical protein
MNEYRDDQHSDSGPRDHTIYANRPDANGKVKPVTTTIAAKFPLLTRRDRRKIQREIVKAAGKERGGVR